MRGSRMRVPKPDQGKNVFLPVWWAGYAGDERCRFGGDALT